MVTKTYCRIKPPLLLLLHGHQEILSDQTLCKQARVHQGILLDQPPPLSPSTVDACNVYKRTRVPICMCAQTHMCAFMYVGTWFVLNQTGFSRNGSKKWKEKIWEGPLPTIARLDQFQIHSQQHLKLFQVVRYKVMFFTTFFYSFPYIITPDYIYIFLIGSEYIYVFISD